MLQVISESRYFIYLSFLFSALIVFVHKKSKSEKMDTNNALDISLILMVFGFIGARFVHVIWEAPFYYRDHFLEIFKFWNGGFVYYGGALTGLMAAFVYVRIKKLNFWLWADFFTPVASIGYALGRVSCLISGCCYGGTCEIWRPIFDKHPTQIYATVAELFVFSIIIVFKKKLTSKATGLLFLFWAILHSIGRLIMEYFRADFRGFTFLNLSLGTLVSCLIILVSTSLIVVKLQSKGRKSERK